MDEIAVCAVDFDHIKTDTIGALGGIGKGPDRALDASLIERLRCIAARIRNVGGAEWCPAAILGRYCFLPFPSGRNRALAAAVIKLAAQLGAAMFAAKRDDACERFLVLAV
jgi:hypothetical protein